MKKERRSKQEQLFVDERAVTSVSLVNERVVTNVSLVNERAVTSVSLLDASLGVNGVSESEVG